MKETIFISLSSVLFVILIILIATNQTEELRIQQDVSQESNKGVNKEFWAAQYYYPETIDEVAEKRYKYIREKGSFDKLNSLSKSTYNKIMASEWTNIGPFGVIACATPGARNDYNYSGRIISLAQDWGNTNVMYLGAASGGIWKSTDRGVSWSIIIDTLAHPSVGTIATNPKLPGEVWIGTGNRNNGVSGIVVPSLGLVYRSTDYGNTWQPVNLQTTNTIGVINKILIRPGANSTLPDVIFIATNIGLYRSADKINWTQVLSGSYSDVVYIGSIFSEDYKIVAARWSPGNTSAIFYSGNKGLLSSFSQKTLPGSPGNIARISLSSSTLGLHQKVYANIANTASGFAGIWRSDDGGNNWISVTNPYGTLIPGQMNINNTILVDDEINGNIVYTGADLRGLFKSTDAGTSWTVSNSDPANVNGWIHEDQHYIHDDVSKSGQIYLANDGGLYKSSDRGNTFYFTGNNYISISQIYNLTVSPESGGLYDGSRYYIGTQDDGVQRGPDEYLRWFALTCCDGIDIAFKDSIHYNIIITGNAAGANRVQQSPPSGVCDSWLPFTQGLPNGILWGGQLIYNGNHFYFRSFVDNILYRAANGILPWVGIQNFGSTISSINVTPENIAVAGIQNAIPVRISNAANTSFSQPTNPASFWANKMVTDIGFGKAIASGRDIYLSLSGTNGIRVARSTDNGNTFINITGDLPGLVNARCILVDPTNDNVIYIGTDFGVYVSFNKGTNWYNYSNKLPAVGYINDLEYDPYSVKIVAATYGRGVFISDRATTSAEESILSDVRNFMLYNNYPNPFNPSTKIKYEIMERSFVSLKVYDALGKEIVKLVDEDKKAGAYEIEFNASDLTSGVYFYKLQAGSFVETKKMVLLR